MFSGSLKAPSPMTFDEVARREFQFR